MREAETGLRLTPLEERVIGVCSDGITKTYEQIADLTGSTKDTIRYVSRYLRRAKGIAIPVRTATPVKDLIIFHVFDGAETIAELTELMGINRRSIIQTVMTMQRDDHIKLPLIRSNSPELKGKWTNGSNERDE